MLRTLRMCWQRLSRFKRRTITGIIFGVVIELVFLLLQMKGVYLTERLEDLSLDWVIQMHSGTRPDAKRPAIPFTVVDIDDKTYQEWKEPLLIPRDKLLGLIRFAVDNKAELVVVDVDLSRSAGDTLDRPLIDYLESRSRGGATEQRTGKGATPIVFVRTFHTSPLPDGGLKPRGSFLDEVVMQAPDNMYYWAAPLFQQDRDFAVRRWRLWVATCDDKRGDVVPSVQSLVTARVPPSQGGNGTVKDMLEKYCQQACPHGSKLERGGNQLERRILYSIPWKLGPTTARPPITVGGRSTPILFQVPAHQVINAPDPATKKAAEEMMRNRVVVIGGSFRDGRDIYATPLGPMPGTFIIVNAVHSLEQYGELHRPPWWKILPATALVIVAVAWCFARFGSIVGTLVSGLILVILLWVSFWLFRSGVWFDFAIPLAGVLLHHLYADVEEALERHPGARSGREE